MFKIICSHWWNKISHQLNDCYNHFETEKCKNFTMNICLTYVCFVPLLRPVYTGDFCRSNSMQFLSRRSCNFKIARVNHELRFRRDFSNLSPRYEIQLTKHGDFE